MNVVTPSMRLKVNRDTFFIPDGDRGVYFRNNVSSFRMEGSTIAQWIDTLLPMLTGKHSLEEMTAGLPVPHRKQVFSIAEVLLKNGFVRDVSMDHPHQLGEKVIQNYASQIEFLDHFGGSGAYRFQIFRQSKVLAIGSGEMMQSLLFSLAESGLEKIHYLMPEPSSAGKKRIEELIEAAKKNDPELMTEEVQFETDWEKTIRPFDFILYTAKNNETDELRKLHLICRQEKKAFVPSVFLSQTGFAGPVVKPNAKGCWESAWRSVYLHEENSTNTDLNTAQTLLANLLVFELFKEITGVNEQNTHPKFYLLNGETLEGGWHNFVPHPLLTGDARITSVEDLELQMKKQSNERNADQWFQLFSQLTSPKSGIFLKWEEGNLKQLPLAQCIVQPVDPLSEGPAKEMPEIIVSDLTHMEARRIAGLIGVETYVQRALTELLKPVAGNGTIKHEIAVGAGETVEEAVLRGMQHRLEQEFKSDRLQRRNSIETVGIRVINDEKSRFYWQSLSTMCGNPVIGLGEEIHGFPVVWVGTNKGWYASPGINLTAALRNALRQAVMASQNGTVHECLQSPLMSGNAVKLIDILTEHSKQEALRTAISAFKQNGQTLSILKMSLQPFEESSIHVYGVRLREDRV